MCIHLYIERETRKRRICTYIYIYIYILEYICVCRKTQTDRQREVTEKGTTEVMTTKGERVKERKTERERDTQGKINSH